MSPIPPIDHAELAEALADLVEKYRLLTELERGEPGRTLARRDAMRTIAARYPGALREWEELPAEVLSRRCAAAEAALAELHSGQVSAGAAGDAALQQSWMRISIAVHLRLRAALAAKRFLAGRPVDAAIAEAAWTALGVSRARLEELARPPGGRVSELVLREVARDENLSVEELKAALFGGSANVAASAAAAAR